MSDEPYTDVREARHRAVSEAGSLNVAAHSTTNRIPTLTPGLTQGQKMLVADMLRRVGCVPLGLLALVFSDVDRVAAQTLDPRATVRALRRGETFQPEPMSRSEANSRAITVRLCMLGSRLG